MSTIIPEYLYPNIAEMVCSLSNAAFSDQDRAERATHRAVVLGLRPIKEGDEWMVLWGENLQVGIAGFGKTPELAIIDFDKAMKKE